MKRAVEALPTPTPTPTAIPVRDVNPAVLPPPMTTTGVGKVCLGLWESGISCLDERGWQNYTPDNSELPSDLVDVAVICPDGRLVIAHSEGLSLFIDQQWEHIPSIS